MILKYCKQANKPISNEMDTGGTNLLSVNLITISSFVNKKNKCGIVRLKIEYCTLNFNVILQFGSMRPNQQVGENFLEDINNFM